MFPIFISPESDQDPRMRTRAKLSIVLGLTIAITLGLMVVLLQRDVAVPFDRYIFISFSILTVIGVIVVALIARAGQETEKRKREGADMYTLIDRLVDDLDDDEAAYLRRRLDDRERGLEETPLEDALKQTLDRREDDRLAGRR